MGIVKDWPAETPIQILCSGNLTVERTLAPLERRVFGNDVTLYSSILGMASAQSPMQIRVSEQHEERFHWLNESLPEADPVACAATVVLASRFAAGITKPDHPYWSEQFRGYRDQWARLHAGTAARLRDGLPKLAGFHIAGALELLADRVPRECAIVSYPPFTQGWGYENLWRRLHDLFDWPRPTYQILDDASMAGLLSSIRDREHWLFAVPERIPDLEPHLAGASVTTLKGVPLFFYASNASRHQLVTPRQKVDPVAIQRFGPGDEIKGPLRVVELDQSELNALRSQYLGRNITPASASLSFGVTLNGLLIGAIAFSLHPSMGSANIAAVRPTDEPRLSKLVLVAAMSREVHAILEQRAQKRIRSLFTTAFTDRPVSMKYRGLFELHSRKRLKTGRNQLNYWCEAARWSLDEGLAQWQKKHSLSASKSSE